jgi:hypothetical protein
VWLGCPFCNLGVALCVEGAPVNYDDEHDGTYLVADYAAYHGHWRLEVACRDHWCPGSHYDGEIELDFRTDDRRIHVHWNDFTADPRARGRADANRSADGEAGHYQSDLSGLR